MFKWMKKSGLAGVLLILIEFLVFLFVMNFLTEIARGDSISEQIRDVDTYTEVINEIQEAKVDNEGDRTIICDEIEINHVYRHIEGEVVSHRLDQLLIRNRKRVHRQLDSSGRVLEDAGWLHLVDGWAILDKCRRYDNNVDQKSWEDWLSGTLRGYAEIEKATIWSKTRYWGEFISPVSKVGAYYTIRLTNWNGSVTIKSKVLRYSHSIIDLESVERKNRGNERKYQLNQMKNAPTVVGDAAVRK